jgi:hypothetical protein
LPLSLIGDGTNPAFGHARVYLAKRIKSFRIAKPRRKLRWTEHGRDDRSAEAYGFFR